MTEPEREPLTHLAQTLATLCPCCHVVPALCANRSVKPAVAAKESA